MRPAASTGAVTGITGVLGQRWRADVTSWGAIVAWDASPPLEWYIAADDRWHIPAEEVAVRQQRVGGTPVFETRVRVPGGDVVHRAYSVATMLGSGSGATVVELTNDSPLPVACAITGPGVLTNRPPTDVPIEGIDLPAPTVVLPIGHRATVAVVLAHDGSGPGPLPSDLPSPDAVGRGWLALVERASRLTLADERANELVVAARCDLLLAGPPAVDDDPAGFLLGLGELVRIGELDAAAAGERSGDVAVAVAAVARRDGWDVDAALDAAATVLARAGDERAGSDLDAIIGRRRPATLPADPLSLRGGGDSPDRVGGGPLDVRTIAAIERRLACGPALFPGGLDVWRGVNIEAHGLRVGPTSTVSFAVRWHGERAAVLWEVEGGPVTLSAPTVDASWRSAEPRGEALWRTDRSG